MTELVVGACGVLLATDGEPSAEVAAGLIVSSLDPLGVVSRSSPS